MIQEILRKHLNKEDTRFLDSIIESTGRGHEIVIHGVMYDVKTGSLIYIERKVRQIKSLEYGITELPKDKVVVLKPAFDTGRYQGDDSHIVSATNAMIPAILIDDPNEADQYITENTDDVFLDEYHLFRPGIQEKTRQWRKQGIRVWKAGLTHTYDRNQYFPLGNPKMQEVSDLHMGHVIDEAKIAFKMEKARCQHPGCNNIATCNQRWVNGKPAPKGHPLFIIAGLVDKEFMGQKVHYEVMCHEHYQPPV
ncbi:hypothetical protein KY328_04285 [Candidatus Woesearchaeota archaeon]|nr:hypothetical protein [Candidatus Woesearchaeota archaeon]MBW3022117.1 hypothetical protein [Candidatus Woesearchaeota archaeon]